MNETTAQNWHELNQRYLLAALAGVRSALERHAARSLSTSEDPRAKRSCTSYDSLICGSW